MKFTTALSEAGRLATILEVPVWIYNRLYWRDDPERYSFYIEPISNWDLANDSKKQDMYLVYPDAVPVMYQTANSEDCEREFNDFFKSLDMIDARMRLIRIWRDAMKEKEETEASYDPTSYTWTHD